MRDIVDDERHRRSPATTTRPPGGGGERPSAALALLNDDTASPASRRLASDLSAPLQPPKNYLDATLGPDAKPGLERAPLSGAFS